MILKTKIQDTRLNIIDKQIIPMYANLIKSQIFSNFYILQELKIIYI